LVKLSRNSMTTNWASAAVRANPIGTPASRAKVDGAKVLNAHMGSCLLNNLAQDAWTTAVGLPGQVADQHDEMLHLLGMTQSEFQCRRGAG
jgi:hypothetical protein